MKIRCIIVDDEPLARQGLENYVKNIGFLNLEAFCENAILANEALNGNAIDLIFLDIHMPKISGLDFLKSLKNPPMIIITTAYPNFALEGYALDVLDYLVKPISFDRFLKAVNKANDYFLLKNKKAEIIDAPREDYFFIKSNNRFEKVAVNDILYVEGLQNYITIHTSGNTYITLMTLKEIEKILPENNFIRVQKSYIVAISRIDAIDANEIIIRNKRIPMSREKKDEIMERILKK